MLVKNLFNNKIQFGIHKNILDYNRNVILFKSHLAKYHGNIDLWQTVSSIIFAVLWNIVFLVIKMKLFAWIWLNFASTFMLLAFTEPELWDGWGIYTKTTASDWKVLVTQHASETGQPLWHQVWMEMYCMHNTVVYTTVDLL